MSRGLGLFLARLFTNENKDLFSIRLGVAVLLGKFKLTGALSELVGYFLRCVLGLVLEDGTFLIDLTLDSIREGKKLKEFEKQATDLYEKVTAKIYDEAKKNEIRKQYLEIVGRIGNVGNPK